MGRTWRAMGLLALLTGLSVVSPASPVQAAGVVGDGTIGSCDEDALNAALAGGGAVSFNCHPADLPIVLTGEKVIAINTHIDGGGMVTLDGQNDTRLFFVNPGVTLALQNLALTSGNGSGTQFSGIGGSIFNNEGAVTLSNSAMSGNTAISGGGVYNLMGTFAMISSTLNDSTATFGGGIYNDFGVVTIANSTLSGNTANGGTGGGIANAGAVTMTNSTLSSNSATNGGGGIISISGTVDIASTIIANSTGGNCFDADDATSLGDNLSDDASCNLNQAGDLDDTAANLGPLANNGGPTLTHLPQAGSPAIDNADCVTSQDQRGITRPQGNGCDIGAVEVRQSSTYLLCAAYYSGAITSPLTGGCPTGTLALDPVPASFCINSWTGQVTYTFGRPCTPPRIARTLATDEVLLTCVNPYSGANRWVTSHTQCNAYERPNTIAPTV